MQRMRAAAGLSPAISGSEELVELRNEIATAEQGARETGQLNPRHPGLTNRFIQFSKKVMRRSLTWYTRPLHQFEGGALRALQHTGNILDYHRAQLHQHSESLNLQADVIERNRTWLADQVHSTALLQQKKLQELQQASVSTATSTASLGGKLEGVKSQVQSVKDQLQGEVSNLTWDVHAVKEALHSLQAAVDESAKQSRQLYAQLRVRERDMRRLMQVVGPDALQQLAQQPSPVPPMFPSEIKSDMEFDYFAFEEQYRGNEGDIRERQKEYLEYFRGRDNVVDIGCGRGEFLELLRDNGISARGVESGIDQCLLCREKGLEVLQQDLFTFLESNPDESLGGIFSAQVIEHMTASDQLRYVTLAYRKTKAGSPVIFETINPQCVYALVRNFFLDPTHVRPIHPETLQFAMVSCNFRNVELRFSAPAKELQVPRLSLEANSPALDQFNAGIDRVNELLYGYQDYAAIGWK